MGAKDTYIAKQFSRRTGFLAIVGGIIGIVVSVKDDTLVIETGSDRSKIRIQKWAIQSNQTVHDNVAPEKK